jgi:hypothetical protein
MLPLEKLFLWFQVSLQVTSWHSYLLIIYFIKKYFLRSTNKGSLLYFKFRFLNGLQMSFFLGFGLDFLQIRKMITKQIKLDLPEGKFLVEADHFDESDLIVLQDIYRTWRELSIKLNKLKSRSVNLPEGLSEVAFCYFMDCVRLNNPKIARGVNTSFDAYCVKTKKRIQIKSCSVLPDLTSFGPNSQWDEIYFQDFYKEGNWDGSVDVYLIPNKYIYNQKVNSRQTLKEMQLEGKRPRFSIKTSIIDKYKLVPRYTYKLDI